MGSGVTKNTEKNDNKKVIENFNKEENNVETEIIHKMYPWADVTIGANPIFPDNHVEHLRRSLELNEKTYQSWINAISDSEEEDKLFKSNKKKKVQKKLAKPKKKIKKSKNSIEPSKSLGDINTSSNKFKRSLNNSNKLQPFTFTRVPTPQSKFLASKNYQHL